MTIDKEMRRLGRKLAEEPPDPKISLDEAIEILAIHLQPKYTTLGTKWRSALSLSVEALKREKARRDFYGHSVSTLLPGETAEGE